MIIYLASILKSMDLSGKIDNLNPVVKTVIIKVIFILIALAIVMFLAWKLVEKAFSPSFYKGPDIVEVK